MSLENFGRGNTRLDYFFDAKESGDFSWIEMAHVLGHEAGVPHLSQILDMFIRRVEGDIDEGELEIGQR